MCTQRLRADMSAETGVVEGSLITGIHNICSMELVSLMLIGGARLPTFHEST